jgi:hypothetical protein
MLGGFLWLSVPPILKSLGFMSAYKQSGLKATLLVNPVNNVAIGGVTADGIAQ